MLQTHMILRSLDPITYTDHWQPEFDDTKWWTEFSANSKACWPRQSNFANRTSR